MKLALTYDEAAEACGYHRDVLRDAVKANELVASYANSKPVFLVTELQRWLESLPTEKK
jgi:hypothetical protein